MLRRSSSFGGSNRPPEAPDLVSGADRKNSPPNETISMQLGGNHLVLKDTGEWTIKSSDLDMATFEIEKLVDDKEKLTEALSAALEQIENLKSEIVEVNNMKSVVLEMVRCNLYRFLRRTAPGVDFTPLFEITFNDLVWWQYLALFGITFSGLRVI